MNLNEKKCVVVLTKSFKKGFWAIGVVAAKVSSRFITHSLVIYYLFLALSKQLC